MSKVIQSHIPCPECTSSDAYCLYDDGHGYCFSCTYYKPPENIDERTTYEIVPMRGLSRETLLFYGIQTKVGADGSPISTGFKYPSGATKVRSLATKEFHWSTGSEVKPELFGYDRFAHGSHKAIIITEGEYDAPSMYQVCKVPSVSVRSSGTALADVASVRSELAAYERIYLALDADRPGRDATASIARLFDPSKVYDIKFTNRKDANEYLAAGEADDLLNLYYNARLYVPDTITNSLSDFKRILTEPNKQGVPYPFSTLTKMTYGIRTGETVLIKAPEKVGKTTLMHTIEHHLLKETDDNVASIFLEEPRLRHIQSLAGIELRKPVHLPDTFCTDDEMAGAIEQLVRKDGRLNIYNHFGSIDPESFIDTIRFLVAARGCRYVLFDHITMAVSGNNTENERRDLEYLATKLEMLVKELDFSLIMVSHVNDLGQTRGSHYLTKVADITISAVRDTMAADDKARRTIQLSIPFNRFCSCTGNAGNLVFDPVTYTLAEEEQLPWVNP